MSSNIVEKSSRAGFAALLIGFVAAIFLLWGAYSWLFCRFYVPPGQMAIVTSKIGKNPAPGAILVGPGEKGIRHDVLAEGRHFLDPFCYEIKIVPAIEIPLGKVGVVTSKIGRELPPGEIITVDRDGKGVWRNVLGPGTYRLNPQGYQVDIFDAINIPVGYVGVVTSQTGKLPKDGEFAAAGEKGVLKNILQPGLYYINSRAYQVNVIEIGMNQVSMSGDGEKQSSVIERRAKLDTAGNALEDIAANTLNAQQELRLNKAMSSVASSSNAPVAERKTRSTAPQKAVAAKTPFRSTDTPSSEPQKLEQDAVIYGVSRFVEFPSRDGFKIQIDMTVEFELMPESISKIYLLYGDLPQVVAKIILPQVLSVSRLKGSSYKAQDFIMGEGREVFQNELRADLVKALAEKNIIVHNAIIRRVEIPLDILTPIRESSLATEQNLTNLSLQETAKIRAELNTETSMIEQRRQEIEQETRKLVAEIAANRKNAVGKVNAETGLEVAKIRLLKAEIEARTNRLKGETQVKTDFMRDNAVAEGATLKAGALGRPGALAELKLIESLNPRVETRIIHAGEGTFWTDLKAGALTLPAPAAVKKP